MLHHRTTDIGIRAGHIAEREEMRVYHLTGSCSVSDQVFRETYSEALQELQPEMEPP